MFCFEKVSRKLWRCSTKLITFLNLPKYKIYLPIELTKENSQEKFPVIEAVLGALAKV